MKKIAISFSIPTIADLRSLANSSFDALEQRAVQRARSKEIASLEAALHARRNAPEHMPIKSIEARLAKLNAVTMSYDDWLAVHGDDLDCEAAESGMDREMDFDKGGWLETKYEAYLEQKQ